VLETSLIRSLIASYFTIVRQSIQDLVPKVSGTKRRGRCETPCLSLYPQAVMHLLVNFSRDGIQARLISRLYKESLFSDLLEEDEATNSERRRVQALLDAYKEAHQSEWHRNSRPGALPTCRGRRAGALPTCHRLILLSLACSSLRCDLQALSQRQGADGSVVPGWALEREEKGPSNGVSPH